MPAEEKPEGRAGERRLVEYRNGLQVPAVGSLVMSTLLVALSLAEARGGRGIPVFRNPVFAIGVAGAVQAAWTLWRLKRMSLEELERDSRERDRIRKALAAKKPWYSMTISAGLVVVAILQAITGLRHSVEAAALVKDAVRAGEVWRLLTAETLHGGLLHLWMNLAALLGLGRAVESLTSHGTAAVTFLASAVGASVFSVALMPETTSVGASGGIMGFIGFLLAASYWRRRLLPGLLSGILGSVAMMALAGVAGWGVFDNAAHLGGLLTGIGVAAVVVDKRADAPTLLKPARRTWPGVVSLGLVIGACALSAVLMLR